MENVVLSAEDLRTLASMVKDYCENVAAFMQAYKDENDRLKDVWKDDDTLEPVLKKINLLTETILDTAANIKQRLPQLLEERAEIVDNRPSGF